MYSVPGHLFPFENYPPASVPTISSAATGFDSGVRPRVRKPINVAAEGIPCFFFFSICAIAVLLSIFFWQCALVSMFWLRGVYMSHVNHVSIMLINMFRMFSFLAGRKKGRDLPLFPSSQSGWSNLGRLGFMDWRVSKARRR